MKLTNAYFLYTLKNYLNYLNSLDLLTWYSKNNTIVITCYYHDVIAKVENIMNDISWYYWNNADNIGLCFGIKFINTDTTKFFNDDYTVIIKH